MFERSIEVVVLLECGIVLRVATVVDNGNLVCWADVVWAD